MTILAEKNYDSFTDTDAEIELKWKEEVRDRQTAYDSGLIPSDSVENVFKRCNIDDIPNNEKKNKQI
jgi:hypothetical protein